MTAEYRDQIAELQDPCGNGRRKCLLRPGDPGQPRAGKRLDPRKIRIQAFAAGMRAYPREMLHNAFAKFEEELKCL